MKNKTIESRAKSKDDNKIVIEGKIPRMGHQEHYTGTGVHHDKRTKRNRTRASQRRLAIKEYA